MRKWITLVIAPLLFASCSSKPEAKEPLQSVSYSSHPGYGPPQKSVVTTLFFDEKKVVRARQKVVWPDQQNRYLREIYAADCSEDESSELFSLVEQVAFLELPRFYRSDVVDGGSKTLIFRTDSIQKTIRYEENKVPHELRVLSEKMQVLEKSLAWSHIQRKEMEVDEFRNL